MITYEGTKLSSRFQVKDQTKFARTNDLAYCCKCPENDCVDFYIGKTDRQISERIIIIFIITREIKIHILHNMHKVGPTNMFG